MSDMTTQTLIKACTEKKSLYDATIGLFLFASPTRGFFVQDILDSMESARQVTDQTITNDEDKAQQLVRALGDGDFRGDLASFPDVVSGKRVFTFVEQQRTQTLTKKVISYISTISEVGLSANADKTGRIRRDGELTIAAAPNSVILGLPSDVEEVIGADKDHSDIVKFDMRSDETYQNVKVRIQSLVEVLG